MPDEVLTTIHKSNNRHDCYAIAARKHLAGSLLESTDSHLMIHGATVTLIVTVVID